MSQQSSDSADLPQADGTLFDNGKASCPFSLKICRMCLLTLPLDDFRMTRQKKKRMRRSSYCKKCTRENTKNWIAANKERQKLNDKKYRSAHKKEHKENNRKLLLMSNYGLTVESYNGMLAKQNFMCAICKRTDSGNKNHSSLLVDHCHETGKIRGLLCNPCNQAIGLFKDNPQTMMVAIEYIQNSRA